MEQKMYISCPVCGRYLSKSGNGTNSDIKCPKCGSDVSVAVSINALNITVNSWSQKQKVRA